MSKLNRFIISANASIFQKINPETNRAVYYPENSDEIISIINFANEHILPITIKGGGSGLSGACTGGSRRKVVISTLRLKEIHKIDFDGGYALVAPGVTPDELNAVIQQQKPNWKFFVAPSSRDVATLGGMLSTDGGGNDAWLAGTMVDNVLAVELIDSQGNIIVLSREKGTPVNRPAKISCTDKELEKKLLQAKFSIMDIAGSHGVLGFITKLKVEIRPLVQEKEHRYALLHADNYTAFGKTIYQFITHNMPLTYGESIVEAHHPEIEEKTTPPMFILEYPKAYTDQLTAHLFKLPDISLSIVDKTLFEEMKDIRINMAKRNPPEGFQFALFEGYGIADSNLLDFENILGKINTTLRRNDFSPFIKYGHAPSLWHVGKNKKKGIIMHSREIRPETLDGKKVFDTIIDLVKTCNQLGITPKPEHKWPYTKETSKHQRLLFLRTILGELFNPFILDCTVEELAEMVL
jgi:hypothetical protein